MKPIDGMLVMTQAAVRAILSHATDYEWSLQGFGMLRLYMTPETRLHVWDSRYMVPGVSVIHDHPWDFSSLIVSGTVRQHRYTQAVQQHLTPGAEEYLFDKILCGPGGGACGEANTIWLVKGPLETYEVGQTYRQKADELHESMPEDGTVTVITRKFMSDPDHARVIWKSGPWVSAEPRRATKAEVKDITEQALASMASGDQQR